MLKKTDRFYETLKEFVKDPSFFQYNGFLQCFFIDYAGNKELLDTINDLYFKNDFSFWTSYKKILKFSKHILKGLSFLHNKTICHLDIKPENIIINTYNNTYKIIDFGFSSMEPFENYVRDIQGTPGYFPKHFEFDKIEPWAPKINANDTILVNGEIPFVTDRKLVYKIDSFCLGRTLYYLKYIYKECKTYECFNCEKRNEKKLDRIIQALLEKDIHTRVTAKQCLEKYLY